MKKLVVSFALFSLFSVAVACSSDDGDSSSSSSSGGSSSGGDAAPSSSSGGNDAATSSSSSGGSSSSSGGAEDCSLLEPTGQPIAPQAVEAGVPESTGGTIADGVYDLTAINIYGSDDPAPPATAQLSVKITGTSFERAYLLTAQIGQRGGVGAGALTLDGINLATADSCSIGEDYGYSQLNGTYTATPTELRVVRRQLPLGLSGDAIELVLVKKN